MSRSRHSKKEVEAALQELEAMGWTIQVRSGGGHAWGIALCPANSKECRCGEYCRMSISSTPQNAGNHAAKLLSKAKGCVMLTAPETEEEADDDN